MEMRIDGFCRPCGTQFLFCELTPDLPYGFPLGFARGFGKNRAGWGYHVPPLRGWGLVVRSVSSTQAAVVKGRGLKPGWKCDALRGAEATALPRHCMRCEMVSVQLQAVEGVDGKRLPQGLKPNPGGGLRRRPGRPAPPSCLSRRLSAALPRHCMRCEMVSVQLQPAEGMDGKHLPRGLKPSLNGGLRRRPGRPAPPSCLSRRWRRCATQKRQAFRISLLERWAG